MRVRFALGLPWLAACSLLAATAPTVRAAAYPEHPGELVGKLAPETRARVATGAGPADLHDYRGAPTLVAFVASWCSACAALEPTLLELSRRPGLRVVAYSNEPFSQVSGHYDGRFPFTVAQVTGRTSLRWGATALPTIALVGPDGIVRGGWRGVGPDTLTALRRAVAQVGAK